MLRALLLTLSMLIAATSVAGAWCCPLLDTLAVDRAAPACPHHPAPSPGPEDPDEHRGTASGSCCCQVPLATASGPAIAVPAAATAALRRPATDLPSPPRTPPLRPPATHS